MAVTAVALVVHGVWNLVGGSDVIGVSSAESLDEKLEHDTMVAPLSLLSTAQYKDRMVALNTSDGTSNAETTADSS